MSDSSVEESDGPIVLCSNCRALVVLTEPKEKLHQTQAPTSRQQSTTTVAPQRNLVKASARKCSIGSALRNKRTALPRSDGALISTHRFITRIIIHVIPLAQAHQ
ncbi:hypothetical protein ACFX2A_024889 [Malus domestica]